MGWETANIHLGSRKARERIRRHLGRMRSNLLSCAAKDMAEAVHEDWQMWRSRKV